MGNQDGRPPSNEELIEQFQEATFEGHSVATQTIRLLCARLKGQNEGHNETYKRFEEYKIKMGHDFQQMEYRARNAEQEASRNKYLAENAKGFEDQVIWLRGMVEKLTK